MTGGAGTHIAVTAWHEAGHALACLREGRSFLSAHVSHSRPGNGVVHQLGVNRYSRYNPWGGRGGALASWKGTLDYSLAEVRILLAGPLAEAKVLNKPLRSLGAKSDLERCQRIAQRLDILYEFVVEQTGLNLRKPLELVDMQRSRVRRWLGRPSTWQAIETVALQLAKTGEASPGQVLRAYLGARASHQGVLQLDWTMPTLDSACSGAAE